MVLAALPEDSERLGLGELSEGVGRGLVVELAKSVGCEMRSLRQSRLCAEQTAGWWRRGGRVTGDESESCLRGRRRCDRVDRGLKSKNAEARLVVWWVGNEVLGEWMRSRLVRMSL